jgi:hypothetical protein
MSRRWLACLLPGLLHCSLLYGDPPKGQCATDIDCEEDLGIEGLHCDIEHGVCVLSATSDLEAAAAEPALCPTGSQPAPSCAETDARCSALSSRECPCLEGDWENPNALVMGTISPHHLRTALGAPLEIPYVPRWLKTIDLALAEWRAETPGGRLARSDRPLALLHCNSNDDLLQARRAMAHLIDVAQAPIVLTLTDNDTNAVRYQALRQGTTLLCSTCFSTASEAPAETSLVWQIAPPLIAQAPLAAWRVAELASALRSERTLSPDLPIDVVILSQDYPGINEFVAEVELLLERDGVYQLTPVQTTDPRALNPVQIAVTRAVVAAQPQVIVVGMDTDFTTYYLRMIEAEWPPSTPRPHYVLTYMNQELGLFADIVQDNDELRRRVGGTGWGPGGSVAQNLAGLEQRFARVYAEPLANTQYGYDAFYSAAYALMLTDHSRALDGQELSTSLGLLGTGPRTNLGPEALRSSLGYLLAGQTLDLVGTSNELDWHPTRHQPESDVVLWCLARDAEGQLALLGDAGPRWQHATGEISGSYACP